MKLRMVLYPCYFTPGDNITYLTASVEYCICPEHLRLGPVHRGCDGSG